MSAEFWLALGGLSLHGMAMVSAGIWQLSKVRTDLMQAIADHRTAVQGIIDDDRRTIAESVQAIRQKINDVELEAYKTFVRRDSFHEIMNRVSAENAAYKQAVEARLDRQEIKIDKLLAGLAGARD